MRRTDSLAFNTIQKHAQCENTRKTAYSSSADYTIKQHILPIATESIIRKQRNDGYAVSS